MTKKLKLPNKQKGGIVDPRGQWAHPGEVFGNSRNFTYLPVWKEQ